MLKGLLIYANSDIKIGVFLKKPLCIKDKIATDFVAIYSTICYVIRLVFSCFLPQKRTR
jgi:hypothetical protein